MRLTRTQRIWLEVMRFAFGKLCRDTSKGLQLRKALITHVSGISKTEHKRLGCSTKKRHPTEAACLQSIHNKPDENSLKLYPYKCDCCEGWHKTKSLPKQIEVSV